MLFMMEVYSREAKALKAVKKFNTADPEECLELIKAIWKAGGRIAENMEKVPTSDKESLFNYLNSEAFPQERYTKQVEEIHEALGLELS